MTTETEADRTIRLALRKLSDDLDDARHDFASANGEDYGKPDYANANEYRDEGFALGEEAFDMPEDDRADYIQTEVHRWPDYARFLVECAADYRLLQLVWDEAKRADEAEQNRMRRGEADDFRRANPLEPDFRRLGQ